MMSVFQAVANGTFRLSCDGRLPLSGIEKSIPDGKEQRLQTKREKVKLKHQ
jgi:hypothetical protein